MKSAFDPEAIEKKWYAFWEKQGCFKPSGVGNPYCIMIPPPNVTGTLHMGHAFQDTLMDLLIRYHRMQGRRVLWQAGTDHAGIATQLVVERQLQSRGTSRQELGRDRFVQAVWDWKQQSGGTITKQLRRLGASVDWSRERFTLDEGLSEAVTEVFVRLYQEGLVYRGKRLVNWDPVLQTAVSDLEVLSEEEAGFLWFIRYPLVDDPQQVMVVATTRPETLLGDVAIAVHPEDPRYQSYIGKQVTLPLTDRTIPIIADEFVDPTFGTGCLKITPAHDFNDYIVGERHQLPLINIFTPEARLNNQAPKAYQELSREEARTKIVADLTVARLLEKIEPHTLKVPRGDRTGVIIEPYLTDQWFVKTKSLAEAAIRAVETGEVRFVPDNWKNTYFEWMHRIEDWCISRQLWWGHRIPAWYDKSGRVFVGRSEAAVRQQFKLLADIDLRQDEDVLDTWFSSALWPFSTLGWPEKTVEYSTFYPTQVLVTGFDIIFFWVARMIMMGLKFTGQVPFETVYVHGLILDSEGQKMSKSKGNILDPIDLIDGIDLETLEQKRTENLLRPEDAPKIKLATQKQFPNGIPAFGTDALRFTFCALASPARLIRFDLNRIAGYRNFCNKLWNATRFVWLQTENYQAGSLSLEYLGQPERWITQQLNLTIQQVAEAFRQYRFDQAANALYEFIWHAYCDWYVELAKYTLNSLEVSPKQRQQVQTTLLTVLETTLRLAHPLMPFITEELWQLLILRLGRSEKTIMLADYPVPEETPTEPTDIPWLKACITQIRTIRSEMDIPPSQAIACLLRGDLQQQKRMAPLIDWLLKLARLKTIQWVDSSEHIPVAATAIVEDLEIHIPLAGLIEKEAELIRLNKKIQKLEKERERSAVKLDRSQFIEQAPQSIVDKERKLLEEAMEMLRRLDSQRRLIERL